MMDNYKSVKGYITNDLNYGTEVPTNYITDVRTLTKSDFTIPVNSVTNCDDEWCWKNITTSLRIELKPEIFDDFMKVLPIRDNDYMGHKKWGVFTFYDHKTVKMNGISNESAQLAKLQKQLIQTKEVWKKNVDIHVNLLVKEANDELMAMVEFKNRLYMETHIDVLNGKNICKDWVEEKLPTPHLDKDIEDTRLHISELEDKLDGIVEARRYNKNKQMLAMMEKDNWEAESEDKDKEGRMPQVLIDKMKEIYNNGEAFKESIGFGKLRRH